MPQGIQTIGHHGFRNFGRRSAQRESKTFAIVRLQRSFLWQPLHFIHETGGKWT